MGFYGFVFYFVYVWHSKKTQTKNKKQNRVQDEFEEIPELQQSPLAQQCLRCLKEHAQEIRQLWIGIQKGSPEIYHAIQTKQAAQKVLEHEMENLKLLMEHGLLEETEFERMEGMLHHKEKSLINKSFVRSAKQDQKRLLHSLPFMLRLSRVKRAHFEQLGGIFFFDSKQKIIFFSFCLVICAKVSYDTYIQYIRVNRAFCVD